MTTVLHVALTGEDNNPGIKEEPLATLHGARDRLRSCESPAEVVVHEGTHYLPGPLELGPEDSGSTYRAADGERVTLSGGVKPESPALKVGFENFPMGEWGLTDDFPETWWSR